MSGIEQHVIFAVTRIRAHFVDPLGNAFPPVLGTGFFLETADGHNILVTNRHNLDPRSKLGSDTFAACELVDGRADVAQSRAGAHDRNADATGKLRFPAGPDAVALAQST
jgi:hypothetical protein